MKYRVELTERAKRLSRSLINTFKTAKMILSWLRKILRVVKTPEVTAKGLPPIGVVSGDIE